MDRNELLKEIKDIVGDLGNRQITFEKVASLIRESGKHRWVGLYDVDHWSGVVRMVAWNGPAAPEFPSFPIGKGLHGAVVSSRKTVNVGNVAADPRYLTAFGTTKSEIIVPIFDHLRERVVATIDVESELQNAFDSQTQRALEDCAELLRPLWPAEL
jgi:putative methionine-R-sulfoxide reductase with GAF domain